MVTYSLNIRFKLKPIEGKQPELAQLLKRFKDEPNNLHIPDIEHFNGKLYSDMEFCLQNLEGALKARECLEKFLADLKGLVEGYFFHELTADDLDWYDPHHYLFYFEKESLTEIIFPLFKEPIEPREDITKEEYENVEKDEDAFPSNITLPHAEVISRKQGDDYFMYGWRRKSMESDEIEFYREKKKVKSIKVDEWLDIEHKEPVDYNTFFDSL